MTHRPHIGMHVLLPFLATVLLVQVILPADASGQARRDIAALVARAQAGSSEEIATLLPALRKSHPDKAGVLFLEALIEPSAERAVELYQRIADEHRGNEWADDALYRLFQYNHAVGAYRTARSYIERIEKEYPRSPFLTREQRASAGVTPQSASTGDDRATNEGRSSGESRSTATRKLAGGDRTTSTAAATEQGASYAVQVGAYSHKADAQKQVDELKTKGYTAYVREKTVNRKTVFAVWLGIFRDIAQAQAFARRMKEQQNIDAIVVQR